MNAGYIAGNILGPLIIFGIMWYVGYRKQSQKTQRTAIIAFLAYECSFLFGVLIALILFAVGFAIFFTCKSYLERKNTNTFDNKTEEPQEQRKKVDTSYSEESDGETNISKIDNGTLTVFSFAAIDLTHELLIKYNSPYFKSAETIMEYLIYDAFVHSIDFALSEYDSLVSDFLEAATCHISYIMAKKYNKNKFDTIFFVKMRFDQYINLIEQENFDQAAISGLLVRWVEDILKKKDLSTHVSLLESSTEILEHISPQTQPFYDSIYSPYS